jgi:hypothetical protein
MDSWIIALAIALAVLVTLALLPIRIGFSLRGRGDPSGAWALAGGGQLGPLALSAVAARGVPASVGLYAFGKRLWQKQLPEPEPEPEPEPKPDRGFVATQRARYAKLERWFDPADILMFVLSESRRIRIDKLDVDVGYSFRDVVLTGKTTAALYVLSGALPAPIVIRPLPSWESVDRADLALSGAIRLWPLLLLVDGALFVVRRVKLRKRRTAEAGPTEAT